MITRQTDDFPDSFYALVEISMGSNCKYEFNEELESIVLDRILFTPMNYPSNYGLIVGTVAKDGDPLDVLLISSAAIQPGILVRCRAVGLAEMKDEEGIDDKVVAVPVDEVDPNSASIKDIKDVSQYQKNIIKHFFEHYKELEEGKFMHFLGFKGKRDAIKTMMHSYIPEKMKKHKD